MLSKEKKQTIASFTQKLKLGEYVEIPNPCLCGGIKDIQIATKDRYGIPQKILLCEICGLMRSDPYYDDKTIASFYEKEYRKIYNNPNHVGLIDFFNEQNGFGAKIYDFLKIHHFRKEITGMKVFEIGCAAGGILQTFKEKGNDVYGCDFGDEYLTFGKTKGLTNLYKGESDTLNHASPADIIILNHTLEHTRNPNATLRKISQLLKDDGVLYIALPGIYAIHQTYRGKISLYLQNAHAWYFTLATLNLLLANAGFKLKYGQETIMAIYQKDTPRNSLSLENSDSIKNYLKKTKRLSLYYGFRAFSLKHQLKTLILNTLRKNQALYTAIRNIYRNLSKRHEKQI